MMKKISLRIITLYQQTLSGLLVLLFGPGCRFQPTCSQYTRQAISKYGPFKGTRLGLARVLRCHPFAKGGLDPLN
jgi:putative membrane protein insertion efficiency factor